MADAAARGRTVATTDTYKSMAYSRGASALGVALALREIDRAAVSDHAVCQNLDLWSGRASTSAGIELMHNEVIVLGNSAAWASDSVIAHRVMRDAIDLPAAMGALTDAGLTLSGQLNEAERNRVLAVLAKADPSSTGRIRGARHIMLDDSDINATRHARALVGGVPLRRHRSDRPFRLRRRGASGAGRRRRGCSDRSAIASDGRPMLTARRCPRPRPPTACLCEPPAGPAGSWPGAWGCGFLA